MDATTYDITALESKYTIIVNNLESKVKLREDQIKQERISNTKKVVQQEILNNDQHNEPPSLEQNDIINESKRPKLEFNICRRD